jgi:hypothetical protein
MTEPLWVQIPPSPPQKTLIIAGFSTCATMDCPRRAHIFWRIPPSSASHPE